MWREVCSEDVKKFAIATPASQRSLVKQYMNATKGNVILQLLAKTDKNKPGSPTLQIEDSQSLIFSWTLKNIGPLPVTVAKLSLPPRRRPPSMVGITYKWDIHVTQFYRDSADKTFVCNISHLTDQPGHLFSEKEVILLPPSEVKDHPELEVSVLWLMQKALLRDTLPYENLEHSIKVTLRKRHKLKIWMTYTCYYIPQPSRSETQQTSKQNLSFLTFTSTPVFANLTVNNYSNPIDLESRLRSFMFSCFTDPRTWTKRPQVEMELPEDVQQSINEFEGKLDDLEKMIEPIFKVDFQTLLSTLAPVEAAKFHLTVAYALNTLFYMYLKTQGHSAVDHPVSKEIERLKEYMQKLQATGPVKGPSTRVNTPAASRVIAHGTGLAKQEQQNQKAAKDTKKEDNIEEKKEKKNTGGKSPRSKKDDKKRRKSTGDIHGNQKTDGGRGKSPNNQGKKRKTPDTPSKSTGSGTPRSSKKKQKTNK